MRDRTGAISGGRGVLFFHVARSEGVCVLRSPCLNWRRSTGNGVEPRFKRHVIARWRGEGEGESERHMNEPGRKRGRCGQSRIMLARSTRQKLGDAQDGASGVGAVEEHGLLNENVLCLVFKAVKWNPFLISQSAMVCKRFKDVINRVIWKEFCLSRAPKMVESLISGAAGQGGTIAGGWQPLGKLMFSCPGSRQTKHFYSKDIKSHFVWKTRFSRTLGKSFLPLHCRSDILFISDCCEHLDNGDDDDLGIYRGIFRAFSTSKTRRFLIENRVHLEEDETCPFCRGKVWSMTGAQLVPPSAVQKLGAYKDNVDYFVCVNGHLHGMASLVSPSDSELSGEDQE